MHYAILGNKTKMRLKCQQMNLCTFKCTKVDFDLDSPNPLTGSSGTPLGVKGSKGMEKRYAMDKRRREEENLLCTV